MTHSSELETKICATLVGLGYTLAAAESCTGGLLSHRLTNVSGSSAFFLGGVVAYSNDVKESFLGVSGDVLVEHGAVSEEVAVQMAEGARERFSSDFGVGVTGMAGPTGATADKPVGLVYVAIAGPTEDGEGTETRVHRNLFSGSRDSIKSQTAEKAMRMLLEQLA